MTEYGYRRAFGVSVVICILLIAALLFVIFRQKHKPSAAEETSVVVAKGPDAASQQQVVGNNGSEGSAPPLTPVQLSPQRLQAIGVKTALVESKNINDELRAPGNVDINEQQVSYV